ncbi:MAG: hypothetical protein HY315_09195 [Acidobacteria bacterium]|nr:hypothetical protein [Acidobacteriota bacterium]
MKVVIKCPTLMVRFATLVVAVDFLFSCSAAAQSLGDLARKERERRAKQTKAVRIIRTEDLKTLNKGKITRGIPPPAAAEFPAGHPGTAAQVEGEMAPSLQRQQEQHWRSLFHQARLQVKLAENRALALELRINQLRNRFFTESDASTRGLIEQEMNRLLLENEEAKEATAKSGSDLKALEERARKANVPASWTQQEPADSAPPGPDPRR